MRRYLPSIALVFCFVVILGGGAAIGMAAGQETVNNSTTTPTPTPSSTNSTATPTATPSPTATPTPEPVDAGDLEVVDREGVLAVLDQPDSDEDIGIDTVDRESSTGLRIGDVEKTDEYLAMTLQATDGLTSVTLRDHAADVDSTGAFSNIREGTYSLSNGETIRVRFNWHGHPDYGYMVSVDDGEQSTTYTMDEPSDDDLLDTIGGWTWLVGVGIGLGAVALAGYVRKRREESQPHKVM